MEIAFDADKDRANLADDRRLDVLGVRFEYEEDRFVAYGIAEERVWVCVFALRGEVHRIISVRKANERETRRYHETPR